MLDAPTPDATPPDTKPSIALGAAVYTVLSVLVTLLTFRGGASMQYVSGCLGCLAILAGPVLAVWHYTSTHRRTLLAGPGAAIGAMAGALGALVAGLLSQLLIALDVFPDAAEAIQIQRQRMMEQGMDPAQVDRAMAFTEKLTGATSNPVVGIVLGVLLAAALGALFGALAATVFKKGGAGPAPIVRERA